MQNNPILQTYLLHKDTEQKNIEIKLKSEHTMKVLQIYNLEVEKSRTIIELSNEILQEAYFVLNGNMLLTDDMREKFGQLYKTHGQRGVKFTESDEIFEISEQPNHTDMMNCFLFEADHLMARDDITSDDDALSSNKRLRDVGDDADVVPTKKRVVRSIFDGQNLDATQVLDTHADLNHDNGNMNATFAIKPATNKFPLKGTTPSSRVLKESNPNVHKGFAAPKPLPKQITKIKSTLIAPQKENKRTPSKIRRSPRGGIADPLNRSKYNLIIFVRAT